MGEVSYVDHGWGSSGTGGVEMGSYGARRIKRLADDWANKWFIGPVGLNGELCSGRGECTDIFYCTCQTGWGCRDCSCCT